METLQNNTRTLLKKVVDESKDFLGPLEKIETETGKNLLNEIIKGKDATDQKGILLFLKILL